MVHWKATKTSLEDTLDVFPCHGVGGAVGMVMTGLLANTAVNSANTTGNGLFFGDTTLFFIHLKALAIVVTYVFVGSMTLLKVTDLISRLHISPSKKHYATAEGTETIYTGDLRSVN
jgi:ammonium transporter, Amt family